MTTTSPIMICPTVPLGSLPDAERDVIRRFLTQHIRGMDAAHDKRWRRMWGDIMHAAPGEGFQLYRAEARGGPYHRMHRAVLTRLFESQEHFTNEDVLHDFVKLKCWFVEWLDGKPVPRSTAFDKASEDEVREFHSRMEALLREPWFQRRLWGHLSPAMRSEMVEQILSGKGGDAQERC